MARLWATRKIGALLKQIQLHGQTSELVNEVTTLSVRYGIITPYTSYLIQENTPGMPGASGGSGSLRGSPMAPTMVALAPAAQSGAQAVDAAQQSGGMAGAASIAAVPTNAPGGSGKSGTGGATPLRQIGDRAFVLRDGTWIDTQYTPGKAGAPAPTAVTFGGDDYFAFLTAHPELADALALGQHVIVVVNGTAYEIKP